MSVGRGGAEREQAIDLTRLIAGIRRRRRWVVWPTILALAASSIFVLVVSPRYTGVAKVLLEDRESYFAKPDKAPGFNPAATIDQEAVQSQAEAVASGDLARKAVWQTIALATLAAFVVSSGVAAAAALAAGETEPVETPVALALPRALAGDASPFPARGGEAPEPPEPLALAHESTPLEPAGETAIEPSRSDALAQRLMRSRTPEGRLAALIVGNGSGRALTLALETARRLSAKGATLLVDLGAAQDWFTDILEREETDAVQVPGLADLLKGNASFGEVIRRDLSSGLDVIPSGGDANVERLEDVLAALTSAYGCVVFHASDWRSAPARLAAGFTDAIVLVAPEAVAPRIVKEAREALGGGIILPFALTRPRSALEEIA